MRAIAEGYEQMAKAAERLQESAAVLRNLAALWPQERMRQGNTVVRAPNRRRAAPAVRLMLDAPSAPCPPRHSLRLPG